MKILKQMISFALCLALVCSLLPGVRASASGLEAYDLTWGIALEYGQDGAVTEVARPGAYTFSGTPGQDYSVECYRVGEENVPLASGMAYIPGHGRAGNDILTYIDLESGDYYFVVTPVAQDQKTPIGSSVTSPIWTYNRPDAKMPTPFDLRWNWPYGDFSPINPVDGVTIVEGEYYFAQEPEDTPVYLGSFIHWDTGRASRMEMDGSYVEACGPGYYSFRVRALSPNVEQYNHGDWSEMSSFYYCETGKIENPSGENPAPDQGNSPFVDVFAGDYFYEPVLWAVERGVTTGMDAEHFAPDAICTRGQIVTFLWRACGSPEPQTSVNPFRDVSDSDYFYKAVLWAVETGVTTGMGDGIFAPEASCTRGQVATFLWRSEGKPAGSSNSPADEMAALDAEYQQKKTAVNSYYDTEISLNEAVLSELMEEAGIYYLNDKAYYQTEIYELQQEITGLNTKYHYTTSAVEQSRIKKEIESRQKELTRLNLCVNACDAQESIESLEEEKNREITALDSWYSEEKRKIEDNRNPSAPSDNPFWDVTADAYYFEPVLWAVENGITNGMGDGSFAPDASCTRGQIVTFLWRTASVGENGPENNPGNSPEEDSKECSAVPMEELPVRVSWKTMNYLLTPAGYETKTTVEIKALTPEFSENSDGTVDMELKIQLQVTYLKQGWSNVSYGVRIYNADGAMVGSTEGGIISAAVGLETADKVTFRDLEPGKYTVEFVDVFD